MSFGVGDIRVERSGEWLLEQIAATGSVVLRKAGGNRAGEMRAHRFLSSRFSSVDTILRTLGEGTAARCAGRHIVAVQDTTEINFAHRDGKKRGFGPAGNGRDPGLFIHPLLAVDAEDEAVVGLLGASIWTREGQVTGRDPGAAVAEKPRNRPIEDKESMRWLAASAMAQRLLATAAKITLIGDSESDIYILFARRPASVDLIVRVAQDRLLADGSRLFAALAEASVLTEYDVRVAPRRPGDKGRIARVQLLAKRITIKRPQTVPVSEPETVEMTLVEAREVDPPKGVEPLQWRLLTTHAAEDAAGAAEIVRLYRLRWRIEQVFRTLKSDGLKLEDSQIEEAERFFRLTAVALGAAVRTIQLIDARDGSPRPATDVIDATLIAPTAAIGRRLEGGTARQKNLHPEGSLAWLSWIAARLGGWNCYYKPPGPKTMRAGWTRLAAMLDGYLIAANGPLP
jgi:DDE family transposase